ncbi:VacJ family lipoprotein [Puniceibacterium sp. IMCC21224]|uniref:MlaA family lipoprotein n=1 Tax=Puniceibacterium sp. IMCC21224 TaxID=1618204 RepID=UPI00064DC5D7|nr:VacJ family lipoprotein [Puniceibacterium sp. IMCC21224]KMK65329.1 surface lipoprotein [Puniceibacterium sp. IMCC21224]
MKILRSVAGILALTLLTACAGTTPAATGGPDGINDPYEAQNRKVHAFNKRLDSGGSGGGVTGVYATAVPELVRDGISNFAETVSLPGSAANHLMQGDFLGFGGNLVRFTINATVGILGLADVATGLNLGEDETDFGETLYVWGAPEGVYLELPVFGASTERDAVGRVIDVFINPLSYVFTPRQRGVAFVAAVAERVDKRARLGNSVDTVLYGSVDSYAQTRIIYLQNRRFELGDTTTAPVGPDADPLALDTEGF